MNTDRYIPVSTKIPNSKQHCARWLSMEAPRSGKAGF